MSDIRPFRGYRPRRDIVEQVASPQYDVLDSDEARSETTGKPFSFLHVTRAEVDLQPGVDIHSDEVYAQGAKNLQRFIDEGILIRDEKPCFYCYRQTMGQHVQVGLVAEASVAEYDRGEIRKHEHTRPDKEDDRTRHVDTLNANTGPVLLTYNKHPLVDRIVEDVLKGAPIYSFVASYGIEHSLWVIDDQATIEQLRGAFAGVERLYVADGHHRSASASRVAALRRSKNPNHTGDEPYNYFLTVMFPDDQMQILGYYRVVDDLNGLEPDVFLRRLDDAFDVQPTDVAEPGSPRWFAMYLNNQWYKLTPRAELTDSSDPVATLDVSILQDHLLRPILGIENPRTDSRISFVGGIRGTAELERRVNNGAAVAFALYPTSVAELTKIADHNRIMPPKSTWFEPKLRAGLVVRSLDG